MIGQNVPLEIADVVTVARVFSLWRFVPRYPLFVIQLDCLSLGSLHAAAEIFGAVPIGKLAEIIKRSVFHHAIEARRFELELLAVLRGILEPRAFPTLRVLPVDSQGQIAVAVASDFSHSGNAFTPRRESVSSGFTVYASSPRLGRVWSERNRSLARSHCCHAY